MVNSVNPGLVKELKNEDLWVKQIIYWRTHLDVFIEDYFKIELKDTQKVMVRQIGNCETTDIVCSRGYGKTWEIAISCIAMGVLYPASEIAVVSGTAEQAVLVLKKIDTVFSMNPNVTRELVSDGKRWVAPLTRNKGACRLKNGSRIESFSLGTFRGNRAKIIIVDEAPEVKRVDLQEIVKPVRNTTRDHCIQKHLTDYPSKIISITSACLKSNYFFEDFEDILKAMGRGDTKRFACALDYRSAARIGITNMSFFQEEKKSMPEASFMMEYGSFFIGAEKGSMFPFELTGRCRKLTEVEMAQPMKSTSEYVMSVDLATSAAKYADNAVITVIKLVEMEDGRYLKKLVFIRSFHGKRLDALANEVRKLLVRFPNTIKVVFDHRGLGDAFPQFLSQPWIDPETNKEYPPLVIDDGMSIIHNAVPLLCPVIANNVINHQIVSCLTVALEQETLELPVSSRQLLGNHVASSDDDDSEKETKRLTQQEKAIFLETDALQIEMGNIVARETSSGGLIYDVAKVNQHKDRYSALGMGVRYISGLEEVNKEKYRNNFDKTPIGVVVQF